MDRHRRLVLDIASKVKHFADLKQPFRISHGSTNSTRPDNKKHVVDISQLSKVLHVDKVRRTALVEPNVPMDRLVEATLPHGLVPPVVMEFPGITVGGGYAGTAGESSSFKHGFFDRTLNSVEMVLGDGEVVTASETQNKDLFRGAAGAVGSLGVTTAVELKLVPAKKYVKTTYWPVSSIQKAISTLQAQSTANDYVDGILFSKTRGAVVTGKMTDALPKGVEPQTFSNPKDPWFYMHVEDKIENMQPVTEYIPLSEYLFRYDRGGFWVGRSAFRYFQGFPFNATTRAFLDDFLHTRMLYRALHASGESHRYMVQDLALPYPSAAKFINYVDDEFGIWPLWLCPLKQSPKPTMHPHIQGKGRENEMMLNIGVWGFGPPTFDEFVKKNRSLERKLRELGGMKWLYAHTYYPETEFWSQFDKGWYDRLRKKYRAEDAFPSVWQKVFVDAKKLKKEAGKDFGLWIKTFWPLGGFWGIWKGIKSKDYLLARNAKWRTRK